MQIKPIGERILIKPIESEERTKGGIYIPESAKPQQTTQQQPQSPGHLKHLYNLLLKLIF